MATKDRALAWKSLTPAKYSVTPTKWKIRSVKVCELCCRRWTVDWGSSWRYRWLGLKCAGNVDAETEVVCWDWAAAMRWTALQLDCWLCRWQSHFLSGGHCLDHQEGAQASSFYSWVAPYTSRAMARSFSRCKCRQCPLMCSSPSEAHPHTSLQSGKYRGYPFCFSEISLNASQSLQQDTVSTSCYLPLVLSVCLLQCFAVWPWGQRTQLRDW